MVLVDLKMLFKILITRGRILWKAKVLPSFQARVRDSVGKNIYIYINRKVHVLLKASQAKLSGRAAGIARKADFYFV